LNSSEEDFEDSDNYWNDTGDMGEYATDAHYCASAFYDYMNENYEWYGLDNNGFELRSVVFGSDVKVANASWNGSYSTFYGGNCNEYNPLTTFGVVGHEFAHAFTEFTSGLIYAGESGALNESISDIFGKALEFTFDDQNKSWLVGNRFLFDDNAEPFRDMSNPNNQEDPKLYGGKFWNYGGVHTQSGVMNFWFYLLSEGQIGENELGIQYDVKKIGFEKATEIVFTMNVAYLTESATYVDALNASVEAVKDLYGESSQEMQSVLEAWRAVGVFIHSRDYDLSIHTPEELIKLCGSGPQELAVEVIITNVGLNPYSSGDVLNLSYEYINEFYNEEFTLERDLLPGDSLQFTFEKPLVVYKEEIYFTYIELNLEAISFEDPNSQYGEILRENNRYFTQVSALISEGKDIELYDVEINSETACSLSSTSEDLIRIRFRNASCDTIFASKYSYSILLNGEEYFYEADFPTLGPRYNTRITRSIELPEGIRKGDDIRVTLFVDDDINMENNTIEMQFERKAISLEEVEDFSVSNVNLLSKVMVMPHYGSDAEIGIFEGEKMLIISGDTLSEDRPLPFLSNTCPEVDVFFGGYIHRTEISACIDTRELENPIFSFDMIQYRKNEEIKYVDPAFTVIAQVVIDGDVVDYIYDQTEGEKVKHYYELPFNFGEVSIKIKTLRGNGVQSEGNNFEDGDFALIDNMKVTSGRIPFEEPLDNYDFYVHPNPGLTNIYFASNNPQGFDLKIYDGLGHQVADIKSSGLQVFWDSQSVSEGVYFYEFIFKDGGRRQGKLVVGGRVGGR